MPKKMIGGTINGVYVKAIFGHDQWFAKPNDHLATGVCTNCPHFQQQYDGSLVVHEDSHDNLYFRKMNPEYVASGSYQSGTT